MSKSLQGIAQTVSKSVALLTSIATVLSLSGVMALAPVASAAVPSDFGLKEGNTISAAGSQDPDIYIVNDWGYKRLFLNPAIFNFYGHLGGFAAVKNVTTTVRDAFPTSGLFRNCETNDQSVWAVEVTGEDTGTLHHVAMSGDAAVAQDSNFFKKVFCINNNEAKWYAKSSVEYTSLSQVPNYSRTPGSTGTPTPTQVGAGPVNVSLSSDNPSAGTVLAGQGVADLLHVHVSNPSGSAVGVTSLKLQKVGIAGDSTFANVYVFNQSPYMRLTDAVTPSSGVINITGGTSSTNIVTVPAYGSVDLAIKSDVLSTASGQTMGVMLTSINGMAVSLTGNLFTVATAPSDIVTAQFATSASLIPSTSNVTSDPLKDTVVWQDTITIGSKNAWLKSFALRQINSINSVDVSNFRLFIDGVQVSQVQNLDANGYATFTPATPFTVLTGTRTVKVLADITGGTSRNLQMSLRAAADVQLIDSNYGSGVTATIASTGTFPLTAGYIAINSGSIVVQKDSSSPSGNIVKGANDAVLGRWTFTAYGEPTKVSTLIVGVHGSSATTKGLRNGRVIAYPVGNAAAAQQYGSTTSLQVWPGSTTASVSYTVNLTVNPGQPMMVEARGDIYDNVATSDTTTAADTLQADLYTGSSNGQGMVSLAVSNVPSARNNANSLTIQAGSATIAAFAGFTNQAITAPKTNAKIGDFVVTGSTNEAINVNTLVLDLVSGAASNLNQLSNVYLKYNGVATSVKSTVGTGAGATSADQTFSLSNTQLAVNGSVHIEVFADISTVTAGTTATFQSTLQLQGTTVQSAQTVQTKSDGTSGTTGSQFSGQTVTVASGSVASAVDASTPTASLNTANSTIDVAKFNFTATNDAFNITEVQLKTVASASQPGIQNVILKKADGTVLGTLPLHTSGSSQVATFGSLSGLTIPANDPNGITLTAAVQTGTVGVNAASTGLNVGITLDYFKNTNSAGTLSTDNNDRAGNAEYLFAAKPTVAAVALPSTLLATGTQTLSKFKISASNGQIAWNQIVLNFTKTSAALVASSGMQFLQDGVDIGPSGSGLVAFTSSDTHDMGVGTTSGTIIITANAQTTELLVPTTGHTYELKASVTTTGGTGNSVTISFNRPSSHAVPNTSLLTESGNTQSLVWSDRVGTGNMGGLNSTVTVHSTTTPDWNNDYLVDGLPLNGQSLSL